MLNVSEIKMTDLAELKTIVEGIQKDLRDTINAKIDKLIQSLAEKDETIEDLKDRVDRLESRVSVLENTNKLLDRRCDDLESYTRRQNLRIVGIPESTEGPENADACLQKVKEEIAKLDTNINLDAAIDRVHRVGPKKDRSGNPIQRAMIVRFTSWKSRTHVYQKRKKGNDNTGARFYVDLTKRRVELKKKAIEKIAGNEKVAFAYADINNNICLLLEDGKKKVFNSEEELDTILGDL